MAVRIQPPQDVTASGDGNGNVGRKEQRHGQGGAPEPPRDPRLARECLGWDPVPSNGAFVASRVSLGMPGDPIRSAFPLFLAPVQSRPGQFPAGAPGGLAAKGKQRPGCGAVGAGRRGQGSGEPIALGSAPWAAFGGGNAPGGSHDGGRQQATHRRRQANTAGADRPPGHSGPGPRGPPWAAAGRVGDWPGRSWTVAKATAAVNSEPKMVY